MTDELERRRFVAATEGNARHLAASFPAGFVTDESILVWVEELLQWPLQLQEVACDWLARLFRKPPSRADMRDAVRWAKTNYPQLNPTPELGEPEPAFEAPDPAAMTEIADRFFAQAFPDPDRRIVERLSAAEGHRRLTEAERDQLSRTKAALLLQRSRDEGTPVPNVEPLLRNRRGCKGKGWVMSDGHVICDDCERDVCGDRCPKYTAEQIAAMEA